MIADLTVEQQDLTRLMSGLSGEAYCGGWIVFDDQRGETWLPLSDWENRYATWRSRVKL